MSSTTNGLTNINFMSQSRYEGLSTYENDELYAVEATSSTITPTMPLLTPIWEDHIVNDTSYLRADTFSWQSGNIYTAAYNHLAEDLSDGNEYIKQHKPIMAIENGCLVVKAGSVVCVPNGFESDGVTKKYNLVTYTTDYIIPNDQTTTTKLMFFSNGTSDRARNSASSCVSSATEPTSPVEYEIWYDLTNNVIKRYISSVWTTGNGYSLPVCYGTWGNATFEGIVQTYSGVNWFEEKKETIGSTTVCYYEGNDGHKLCLQSQENHLMNIYDEVGIAWYYIIDTENGRFKLPVSSFGHGDLVESYRNGDNWYRLYSDGWLEQGGSVLSTTGSWDSLRTVTLIKGFRDLNYLVSYTTTTANTAMSGYMVSSSSTDQRGATYQGQGTQVVSTTTFRFQDSATTGLPFIWQASGYTNTTSNPKEKYLYFFVGNYIKNEQSVDVATLSEELNNKMDLDMSNVPSNVDYVVESKVPTSSDRTWYRVYKSGWVEQGGVVVASNTTLTFPLIMADTNYTISCIATSDATGSTYHSIILTSSKTTTGFNLYVGQYGTGGTTSASYYHNWEVKGMGA